MTLPRFDSSKYTQGDLFTGTFPKDFPAGQAGPMQHGGGQPPPQQGGGHQIPKEQLEQIPEQHRSQIPGLSPTAEEVEDRSFVRRLTTATGYVALGLLALTLLIGPANLLLRRRNPVSSYLRRDVGAWTALFSGVHVIVSLKVHGSGQIRDLLDFFVPNGSPLTNSFGWGNWTGLAALVIVAGLLALSSDIALRKLKAKNWKRLQRLNYALFALVIVHRAAKQGRLSQPELVSLADEIIATKQSEVDQMLEWREQWFGSKEREPEAAAFEVLGLSAAEAGMEHDSTDLASADNVDQAFAGMMLGHHVGAIRMAELAKERAGHNEVKTLAGDIIAAQQREIAIIEAYFMGGHD